MPDPFATAAGEIRDGYDAWKALDAQERATAAAEDRAACAGVAHGLSASA